jgi:hypothetical protein
MKTLVIFLRLMQKRECVLPLRERRRGDNGQAYGQRKFKKCGFMTKGRIFRESSCDITAVLVKVICPYCTACHYSCFQLTTISHLGGGCLDYVEYFVSEFI